MPTVLLRRLELARCSLEEEGLTQIWTGLLGQRHTMEILDTSENSGRMPSQLIKDEIAKFFSFKKLNIAGNSLPFFHSLISIEAFKHWHLEELNLSNIKV
jgi:hypothetical protein